MRTACLAATFLFLAAAVFAQSTDQTLPTPVTGPEIRGRINARDIGDSRLTTYFYAFNGEQGDVFINVVTKNFNGDIDVFAVEGLRPLTKIVIYAGGGLDETGRIIYLRKPERMLLRIEGRTPDDDPALFTIKFAGSFQALKPVKAPPDPGPVNKATSNLGGVRLNSAGAVIPDAPNPSTERESVNSQSAGRVESTKVALKKLDPVPIEEKPPVTKEAEIVKPVEKPAAEKETAIVRTEEPVVPEKKLETDKPATEKESVNPPSGDITEAKIETEPAKPKKAPLRKRRQPVKKAVSAVKQPVEDPLAGVRLIVTLKDGSNFERPMSEVLRFTANRGTLLVIGKDGKIVRYLLTDIASITMQ